MINNTLAQWVLKSYISNMKARIILNEWRSIKEIDFGTEN